MNTPPVIGLVGGIGSGKSTVARCLADLGCVVSDSDGHARAAFADPTIRATLLEWWGDGIVSDDGTINRSAIAAIVFNDAAERTRLEGLTHPWIEAQRVATFAAAPADTVALVIDAPLLLEAGLDHLCDAILFVDVPAAERLRRVKTHRGWTESEWERREESQWSLDDKRSRADYVIRNEGEIDALRGQLHRILSMITGSEAS